MDLSNHEQEKIITIPEVKSFLEHTELCIEALNQAVSQLPKVDEESQLENPFIKELYQKKEEAQKQLAGCRNKLFKYRKWVIDQIKKCKDNLVIVSANADRLNNDLPQQEFTDAEIKLAAIYKKLVRLKVNIEKTIKKSEKAIQQASGKRYPIDTEEDDQDEALQQEREEKKMDEFLRVMLGKVIQDRV